MEKNCKYCGNPYHLKPSHFDKSFYCCKKCMSEDYKIRLKGEVNPNYSNVGTRICQNCGKEYKSYNKIRKYCSHVCYQKASHDSLVARNRAGKRNRNCLECGTVIPWERKYCALHNPNKGKIWICRICGAVIPSKFKRIYCDDCHTQGKLRKPQAISICDNCGDVIPKYGRKYCDTCWKVRMRTKGKIDENQPEIIRALEAIGAQVIDLSKVGNGCPDLIVSYDGILFLLEVKNPKYKWKLNELQKKWHAEWKGRPVGIVTTAEDAIDLVTGGQG